MKATFVEFSHNFFDKHSVYALSAQLRKHGIETDYINVNKFKPVIKYLARTKPDYMLYSSFSKDLELYIKFDRVAKEMLRYPVKSIIGGSGSTFDWQALKKTTIDAICLGEGDYALPDFMLNGTGHRNIMPNGAPFPKEFYPLADLDSLPFPDRDVVYRKDPIVRTMAAKQFLSGRGCPYQCTYCHNHVFNKMFKNCGKVIRKKSVSYLIEELKLVRKNYPLRRIVFYDDTFIIDKKWLAEFADRYPREIGLEYACQVRANLVDEDIVRMLKESKCILATWSIESGNDHIRNDVLKRNMSREQILETARLLRKYGIPSRTGNIVGTPGEKFENMLETLDLNVLAQSQLAMASIFVPYPGLRLTEYAIEHGYFDGNYIEKMPPNYLKSILNYTPEERKRIANFTFLFPAAAQHPRILRKDGWLYKILLRMPNGVMRIFYETYYSYHAFRMLFDARQSMAFQLRLFLRYLGNIYHYIIRF